MNVADNMLSQLLSMTASSQSQAPKPADQTGAKRDDFDALMRQKQQAQEAPAGQKPQQTDSKGGEARPAEGEKVVPEEQRVLAAAMAAQAAVVIPVQAVEAPVEDAGGCAAEAVTQVQAQTLAAEQKAPQQAQAEQEGQKTSAPAPAIRNEGEAAETTQAPTSKVTDGTQKPETAARQTESEPKTEAQTQVRQERPVEHRDIRSQQRREEPQAEVKTDVEAKPLFQRAEAAPVKVGQPEALVNTEDGTLDSQMAARVKEAVEQGAERVEVKLTPRSMGEVTIELTRSQDGALHVTLHATTERGASLLSEHANGLSALLQNGAQAHVNVEVQRPQQLQQPQQSQQEQNDRGWDGHQGNPNQQQSQQQRRGHESQDFMQQLRLGLVTFDLGIS